MDRENVKEIEDKIRQLQFEEIQLLAPLREYESRIEAIDGQIASLRIFQRKERKALEAQKAEIHEEKRRQDAEIWKKRNQIHARIRELKEEL